eukprot:2865217-Pyramimonas_sp.AAC.1
MGEETGAFWVFRRFAYTEVENPDHMLAIMGGDAPIHLPPDGFVHTKALDPTVEEILRILVRASEVRALSRAGA